MRREDFSGMIQTETVATAARVINETTDERLIYDTFHDEADRRFYRVQIEFQGNYYCRSAQYEDPNEYPEFEEWTLLDG